jgi:hypothetical protein
MTKWLEVKVCSHVRYWWMLKNIFCVILPWLVTLESCHLHHDNVTVLLGPIITYTLNPKDCLARTWPVSRYGSFGISQVWVAYGHCRVDVYELWAICETAQSWTTCKTGMHLSDQAPQRAFRRPRYEDSESEASLGYIVSSYIKRKQYQKTGCWRLTRLGLGG